MSHHNKPYLIRAGASVLNVQNVVTATLTADGLRFVTTGRTTVKTKAKNVVVVNVEVLVPPGPECDAAWESVLSYCDRNKPAAAAPQGGPTP